MLIMKSGKRHMTEGIILLNQDKLRRLGDKETLKYLRILEADAIKQLEKKLDRIPQENEKTIRD